MEPLPIPEWSGRDDGPGLENARWFNTVRPLTGDAQPGAVLLGFASDEGVRRNLGRTGARKGPPAIRKVLGSFALQDRISIYDAGDVDTGDHLEAGQEEFGRRIAAAQAQGHFTVGLGGGHEITWASYRGMLPTLEQGEDLKLGILNLDAHFDLRKAETATSGTGFEQIATAERAADRYMTAAALGISEHANTRVLFDRADELGLRYRFDDECRVNNINEVVNWVDGFLASVDLLYLTVDLDVLPGFVAPGVSAPAAVGVPHEVIEAAIDHVAVSDKLIHVDIAELNPELDIGDRTARAAARFVHRIVSKKLT